MDDASDAEKAQTNAEIRQWYLELVSRIPALNREWLRRGLSAKERAEKAWSIRHDARLQSRAMMADAVEVELLRRRDAALYGHPDGPTFESLVDKLREAGLEDDAIYEAIIEGAYRTDSSINRSLGL